MIAVLAVRPAPEQRRSLAVWASERGLNTVSADSFGVPAHQFADVPEPLLVGAVVDDQPYVPREPS